MEWIMKPLDGFNLMSVADTDEGCSCTGGQIVICECNSPNAKIVKPA